MHDPRKFSTSKILGYMVFLARKFSTSKILGYTVFSAASEAVQLLHGTLRGHTTFSDGGPLVVASVVAT